MNHVREDGAGVRRAVSSDGIKWCGAREHAGYSLAGQMKWRGVALSHRHQQTRAAACLWCGATRLGTEGPHAPLLAGDGLVRDCVGALWRKTDGGYVRQPR